MLNTCWALQELAEWNSQYQQKFGFVFLICASGMSTDEILAELKVDPSLKFMMMVSSILALFNNHFGFGFFIFEMYACFLIIYWQVFSLSHEF